MGQLWSIHLFWAALHPVILWNAEALPMGRGSLHSLLYCGTVHVCLCTCVCKIVTFNIFMNKIVENKHRKSEIVFLQARAGRPWWFPSQQYGCEADR